MKLLILFFSTQGFLLSLKLTDTQMTWLVALIPVVLIAIVFIVVTFYELFKEIKNDK